ncbi:MAG: S9 family peptidase [Opitutae bacterium]|nr:S9 family peptidase [Opitutae bacterium]
MNLLRAPRLLAAAVCGALSIISLAGAERPPLIPAEQFFAEADLRTVRLSPDGKNLAFLTTLGTGKVGIALMHLDTGKVEPLVVAKDENIESFGWKGSDYIVYAGDVGGNESPAYRSISLSKRRVVALAESYRERFADRANFASLVDWLEYEPNYIMIIGPREIGSFDVGVYRMDIRNGERRPVPITTQKNDEGGFIVDCAGVIRARSRLTADKIIFEVRRDSTSGWSKVAEFPSKEPKWDFLEFAADNETLYFISREHTDTMELRSINCRTLQVSESLFHNPDGDVDGIITSYDRTKLYGVSYETDKAHYHWISPARAQLQAKIDATLPGTVNNVISTSADEQVMVVHAGSDRDPGTYYVLDLRAPRLMALGKINRFINPAQMQPMEPVQFTARDGLVVHGYLTRAAGSDGKPAPLIINPHGGPFGIRDSWGFNPEVQFLANRGYSVLQINYRGSGGYGYKFQEAGKREWGGKMQDDLTDGVKWAIDQKIADPARVAIYGASYGGYAALAGATFTPDLYKCAVNYVGVSDLGLITSWGRGRFDRSSDEFYQEWVGDDPRYKFDRSPVNFVERIKIPTLHAYGFNDPRVEIDNWKRLEAKLKQFGKTYEIVIAGNEGHGFRNENSRIGFYQKLESFFSRYLVGEVTAAAKPGELRVVEMPAKDKP